MTPDDLLAELEAAGLTLQREGDKLMASPPGAITPALAGKIRAGKEGLLVALSVRQAMADARDHTVEETDLLGESVRLVERVVLVWPDGEAMAFDPTFVQWWEKFNAESAMLRQIAERRTTRKKAAQ